MSHFVYVLRSEADGTYYVGATSNLEQRIARHNSGGSVFTRNRRPWKVVYVEQYAVPKDALRRERQIRQRKSRIYIEALISSGHQFDCGTAET